MLKVWFWTITWYSPKFWNSHWALSADADLQFHGKVNPARWWFHSFCVGRYSSCCILLSFSPHFECCFLIEHIRYDSPMIPRLNFYFNDMVKQMCFSVAHDMCANIHINCLLVVGINGIPGTTSFTSTTTTSSTTTMSSTTTTTTPFICRDLAQGKTGLFTYPLVN